MDKKKLSKKSLSKRFFLTFIIIAYIVNLAYAQNYALILADAQIKNYYSSDYVSIKIRNIGASQARYNLSLDAPGWITLEPKELVINPGQSGNLNLNINPGAEIPEGKYSIKINAKLDEINYTKNVEIVLSKGNGFLNLSKTFFVFYQYYIYSALFIIAITILFLSRKKIKSSYKNYRIRKARLRSLEKARKVRQEKIKNKKN